MKTDLIDRKCNKKKFITDKKKKHYLSLSFFLSLSLSLSLSLYLSVSLSLSLSLSITALTSHDMQRKSFAWRRAERHLVHIGRRLRKVRQQRVRLLHVVVPRRIDVG